VRIDQCDISTGDDCIAIKSGPRSDGRRVNRPTRDVKITDCTFRKGHRASRSAARLPVGIRDITIQNCNLPKAPTSHPDQTMRGRGATDRKRPRRAHQVKDVERDGHFDHDALHAHGRPSR